MHNNFTKTLLVAGVLISSMTSLQTRGMLEDRTVTTPVYHLHTSRTSMMSDFLKNQAETDKVEQVDNARHQAVRERYEIQNKTPINIELTFYTGLVCENTIHGAVDAIGNDLKYGTVAIPRDFELGTQFEIDGYNGTFNGTDRGSIYHIRVKDDGTIRLDMFIPRNDGESDDAWWERVNAMGRIHTTGYIIEN